jgi:NAD(P)-dependent dehydrogenase (short-subunit alcohol dehydrogenase family)
VSPTRDRRRLVDRVAVVTGAGQGIGAAIVEAFVDEGATVVAIDRNAEPLRTVAAAFPGRVHPEVFDVTDASAFAASVDRARARLARIDVLVNNAAISPYATILEDSTELWQRTLETNLLAAHRACQLVAPAMIERAWGRIVNVGSAQALATEGRLGAYAASKGALHAFTRSLAVDLAPHGILANAIAPGCIHTPLSIVDGVDETTTDAFRAWYVGARKIPLARAGEPHEVARAAVFLASDDCSYLTGHTLVVDGGLTITF